VLPRSAPDLTPELFTGPPTGGESYVFFDDADTQVIAAVSPGSRFRFMIGKREPEVRGTTYSKPVLIIDEEADDEG